LRDYQGIEAKTRSRLEREYKVHLRRGKAELLDGTIAEFDTISDDKNVIGEIKASEPRKQGKLRGRVRTKTQFGDFSRGCMKLAAAKNSLQISEIDDYARQVNESRVDLWQPVVPRGHPPERLDPGVEPLYR
jgi:hypothetical protein